MSGAIGPSASGMRPTMSLAGRRPRPVPVGLGGEREPVTEHCGDVLGIVESISGDGCGEQPLDVVAVGFGTSEFGGEWTEGFRLDR